MNEVGRAFVQASRKHLVREYVPKIRQCLQSLTDEELWWRPGPESNSVGNLVLHLCGNARQWIVHGVAGAPDVRERPEEFARDGGMSGRAMVEHLETALREVDGALADLEERVALDLGQLLEGREIQGLKVSVLEAVYHVVEHVSQHAGQIYYITKMRTGADLGFWVVKDGKARPNW